MERTWGSAMAAELARDDLVPFVDAIARHDVRLVTGLDAGLLAEVSAAQPPSRRPILLFEAGGDAPASQIVEEATGLLSRAVAELWPFAWGGEDFSTLGRDALSRAHLPIRLAGLVGRLPDLSQEWARSAALAASSGSPPRVAGAAPALEWAQLVLAFSPSGLTLAAPVPDGPVGDDWVLAIEWLAQRADIAVVALAGHDRDEPALERISFGARALTTSSTSAAEGAALADETGAASVVLALPDVDGRPHPQSAVEMRLFKLIQADDHLQPLFAFNKTLQGLPLLNARADLLWEAGRVVVEVDGREHRVAEKYRADRYRDYRLMCAGYRVLRITNEDVLDDAPLAVERIREVVRLAAGELG